MPAVVIDGIVFSLQSHGGISESVVRQLFHLAEAPLRLRLLLYPQHQANRPLQTILEHLRAAPTVEIQELGGRPQWERWRPCGADLDGADVFHSTYYRLPRDPGPAVLTTVHDLLHLRYRRGLRRAALTTLIERAIHRASRLVCVSEQTCRRVAARYPAAPPAVVLPHAAAAEFRPQPGRPAAPRQCLFVGERGGYKNFALAVEAVARVPQAHLGIVGGGALSPAEQRRLQQRLPGRYQVHGWVDAARLNTLYNEALALLYLSREEGFGMPVLEAANAGCPAITLHGAVAAEAGAREQWMCAEDPAAVADCLRDLLAAPAAPRPLHGTRAWADVARELAAIYADLAAGPEQEAAR